MQFLGFRRAGSASPTEVSDLAPLPVEIVARPPGGLFAGTKSLTTTVAAAISTPRACTQVLIQNDPDNLVDVLVGTDGAQVIQLTPGQAITIVTSDVANVYAKNVSSTTQSVNYLATLG